MMNAAELVTVQSRALTDMMKCPSGLTKKRDGDDIEEALPLVLLIEAAFEAIGGGQPPVESRAPPRPVVPAYQDQGLYRGASGSSSPYYSSYPAQPQQHHQFTAVSPSDRDAGRALGPQNHAILPMQWSPTASPKMEKSVPRSPPPPTVISAPTVVERQPTPVHSASPPRRTPTPEHTAAAAASAPALTLQTLPENACVITGVVDERQVTYELYQFADRTCRCKTAGGKRCSNKQGEHGFCSSSHWPKIQALLNSGTAMLQE